MQFCVLVRSCCIGGFAVFFLAGIFFDRALSSDFVFSASLQNFCCRITETSFFRSFVSFSIISIVCVLSFRLNDTLQPLLQGLITSYNQLQKIIIPPQRHHLSSCCCFLLCVSVLANLPSPLSRSGAFLYSRHISALMFCAFLLRNSQ